MNNQIEEMAKLDIEESGGFYSAFINNMRISKNKPLSKSKTIMTFYCPEKYIKESINFPKDSVVLSRGEFERLKRIETEKHRLYEMKLDLENQLIEKGWTDYEGADEIEKRVRKETAREILNNLTSVIHDNRQYGSDFVVVYMSDIDEIAKQYGVEIEK